MGDCSCMNFVSIERRSVWTEVLKQNFTEGFEWDLQVEKGRIMDVASVLFLQAVGGWCL